MIWQGIGGNRRQQNAVQTSPSRRSHIVHTFFRLCWRIRFRLCSDSFFYPTVKSLLNTSFPYPGIDFIRRRGNGARTVLSILLPKRCREPFRDLSTFAYCLGWIECAGTLFDICIPLPTACRIDRDSRLIDKRSPYVQ